MWLSNCLGTDLISSNKSYAKSLEEPTPEHRVEDHMVAFVSTFAPWFALNPLDKLRGTGVLSPESKILFCKSAKKGLARRFPEPPLLICGDGKWGHDVLKRFS